MHKLFITYIFLFLTVIPVYNADSKVYLRKDQALQQAFPEAQRIEKIQVFLNPSQVERIESMAMSKLDSKLFIFYTGIKDGETLGYAIIDTHRLRTKTETVMYVISPDGTLAKTEILAFFEPTDYQPGDKWLDLYSKRRLDDSIRIGRDIPNITGATITSHAFAKSVRRILAIYEIAIQDQQRASN